MTAYIHQISTSNGGVPKLAVEQVEVTAEGVSGDRQRNKKFHGGPTRAVCLYSLNLIEDLQAEGHPIVPGGTGENLTIAGFDQAMWATLQPGSRLKIGPALEIEVTSFANPCSNIAANFSDGDSTRISEKLHSGWSRLYAKVLTPGRVTTGDPVQTVEVPV
jgi:MOSC domain-containing protein YiiM